MIQYNTIQYTSTTTTHTTHTTHRQDNKQQTTNEVTLSKDKFITLLKFTLFL